MKHRVLEVLRLFKAEFSWLVEDIKGMSSAIYLHKILIEEEFMPSQEHQRRLNLGMKEVLKWL